MNLKQMTNLMQATKSPRDAVLQITKMPQFKDNKLIQDLVGYAEQGRSDKIEEFARNFCKEKGIDFEEQANSIKSMLGMFWK